MAPYISSNEQCKSQVAEIFLTFKSKEIIKRFKIPLFLHEPGNQPEFLFRADDLPYFFPEIPNFASKAVLAFNWGEKKGLKCAGPIDCCWFSHSHCLEYEKIFLV